MQIIDVWRDSGCRADDGATVPIGGTARLARNQA
jgi:hypothetical protein